MIPEKLWKTQNNGFQYTCIDPWLMSEEYRSNLHDQLFLTEDV
jgi:hypothetical protein